MPRAMVGSNKRMSLRIPEKEKAMLLRAASIRSTDLSREGSVECSRQLKGIECAGESTQAECTAIASGEEARAASEIIPDLREEAIGRSHDRKGFDWGGAAPGLPPA